MSQKMEKIREDYEREIVLRENVGLENLPYQIVKQNMSHGFSFNILCIGETGIGKSTLISSLFNIPLEDVENIHTHPKVTLQSTTHNLQESGVCLQLKVVETVGYGDQIQKENSFDSILNHIDEQYEIYLREELDPDRQIASIHDTRIHACLFFICPTGHSLKSLDLACLKCLDGRVNIIPLIAKADTLSQNELQNFKSNIRRELEQKKIRIYEFPTDDDPVVNDANSRFNSLLPFGVVGSTELVIRNGNRVRGRSYPWGTVYIKNEEHSDTSKLLEAVIETNLEDLKEQTHVIHYENYRTARLEQIGVEINEKGLFNPTDVWLKLKMGEGKKEVQNQEAKVIQKFVDEAKGTEKGIMFAEMTMRDKLKALALKAKTGERECSQFNSFLEENFPNLKIDSLNTFLKEIRILETDD